jgi:hypothetical protein
LHRALFDDENDNVKMTALKEPFSISRNLHQRKHDGNSMEIKGVFDGNANFIAGRKKFNNSVASRQKGWVNQKTIALNGGTVGDGGGGEKSQSCLEHFKSAFRCSCVSKISEQIELNYPLNLHLRMNEIFSMHDKLCDIAECFNDLYSVGM